LIIVLKGISSMFLLLLLLLLLLLPFQIVSL
jgi:hypothetical protein